jgi:hypothetical protein
MIWPLLIAFLGCSPGPPQESGDPDGTPSHCSDDPDDANTNGVADACERELLGSFQTETIFLDEPAEHVLVWLACRVDADVWNEVQPGIEVRLDDQGPLAAETATLDGWDAFRDCSARAGGQNIGTYVRLLDYPLAYESGAGVASNIDDFEALEEDDIYEIAVKVVSWELQEEDKLVLSWYFFGAPGVR